MNWHDYFTYNAGTGNLIWKERPRKLFSRNQDWLTWNIKYRHKVAGAIRPDGYVKVVIFGRQTLVHRIVWEMHHGSIRTGAMIDHKDGDPMNNTLSNLRVATDQQNSWNTRRRVSSRRHGVRQRGNRFESYIHRDGRYVHLGTYDTEDLAHSAHCEASKTDRGEFSCFQNIVQ